MNPIEKIREFANAKLYLASVLEEGEKSIYRDVFIKLCKNMSIACLRHSQFRNELLEKEGLSEGDLAFDLIAELFAVTDDKYTCFNNYFTVNHFSEMNNDVVISKLFSLINSRINQEIRHHREQNGEIYFKIKRAFDNYLKINSNIYKRKTKEKKEYLYTSEKIRTSGLPVDESYIIDVLQNSDNGLCRIPDLVKKTFEHLNKSGKYTNIIEYSILLESIVKFYKARKGDQIY